MRRSAPPPQMTEAPSPAPAPTPTPAPPAAARRRTAGRAAAAANHRHSLRRHCRRFHRARRSSPMTPSFAASFAPTSARSKRRTSISSALCGRDFQPPRRERLRASFSQIDSQQVDIVVEELRVDGRTATVRLSRRDTVMSGGRRQTDASRQTLRFEKAAAGWIITEIIGR